jgi:hypothetical protein
MRELWFVNTESSVEVSQFNVERNEWLVAEADVDIQAKYPQIKITVEFCEGSRNSDRQPFYPQPSVRAGRS